MITLQRIAMLLVMAPIVLADLLDTSGSTRVFVYTNPAFDHHDLIECYREQHKGVSPWQDERAEMAQNMGEIWMHKAMMEHPWRVFDAEDADLFHVPIYPVLRYTVADFVSLLGAVSVLASH